VVSRHSPTLTFTLKSPPYMLPVRAIQVSTNFTSEHGDQVADGLNIASSPRALNEGVSATAAGAPVALGTEIVSGELLIYLAHAASPVTAKIAAPAISADAQLVSQARRGQHPPVELFMRPYAEPRNAAVAAVSGQPCLVRGDLGSSGGQELESRSWYPWLQGYPGGAQPRGVLLVP